MKLCWKGEGFGRVSFHEQIEKPAIWRFWLLEKEIETRSKRLMNKPRNLNLLTVTRGRRDQRQEPLEPV